MVSGARTRGRLVEPLTQVEIRAALDELAERLSARRAQGRLYVADGAAMALAYDSDKLTRDIAYDSDNDIDAAIIEGHGAVIEAAREIALSRQWPTTWLNEQATPYMPTVPDRRGLVVFDHPALKVVVASREHMLAMKVRAARSSDVADTRRLLQETGLSGADEVEALVESVFPGECLGGRQRRWLEDLLTDIPTHPYEGALGEC